MHTSGASRAKSPLTKPSQPIRMMILGAGNLHASNSKLEKNSPTISDTQIPQNYPKKSHSTMTSPPILSVPEKYLSRPEEPQPLRRRTDQYICQRVNIERKVSSRSIPQKSQNTDNSQPGNYNTIPNTQIFDGIFGIRRTYVPAPPNCT